MFEFECLMNDVMSLVSCERLSVRDRERASEIKLDGLKFPS